MPARGSVFSRTACGHPQRGWGSQVPLQAPRKNEQDLRAETGAAISLLVLNSHCTDEKTETHKDELPASSQTASRWPRMRGQRGRGPSSLDLLSCAQDCFLGFCTTKPLFAPPAGGPCPWALLRLMQPFSRLQGSVPLPSWLHPLTLPLTERRVVCQAMEGWSGLPQGTALLGAGWKEVGLVSPTPPAPSTLPAQLWLPPHLLPGTPVAGAKIKLCAHAGHEGQLKSEPLAWGIERTQGSGPLPLCRCPQLGRTTRPGPHSHPGPSDWKLFGSRGQVC